jgi:hypothetical protein
MTMTTDPEELFEEDADEKERRPLTAWLIAIFLLLLAFGSAAIFLFRNPEPPDEPFTIATEVIVDEVVVTEVVIETVVITEIVTEEVFETVLVTEEVTEEAEETEEATEEATEEVVETEVTVETEEATEEVVETEEGRCGDGVCNPETENSDICRMDCRCVDDGECGPGEGSGCQDCGASAGGCGNVCTDSSQCKDGLSCAGGRCWDACECGGICGDGVYGAILYPDQFVNDRQLRETQRTHILTVLSAFLTVLGLIALLAVLLGQGRAEGARRPLGQPGNLARRALRLVMNALVGIVRLID